MINPEIKNKMSELTNFEIKSVDETVKLIAKLIKESTGLSPARAVVEDIIAYVKEKDWKLEVEAIYKYARQHFRYTKDVYGEEFMKTPERIFREISERGFFLGDCDDAMIFIGSLLKNAGYPVFATIVRREGYSAFTHIYPQTMLPTGEYIALDITLQAPFNSRPEGVAEEKMFKVI
jgi:hypothetical protein